MCGIVGYVGQEAACPILLEGLSRLEYRGYDSAGVAVCAGAGEGLSVHKAKGRLQVLSELLQGGAAVQGEVGIGHTRWATHGAPSDVNSHPQVSQSRRIAVVHNGIIENYVELRAFLMEKGVPFVSETDTEVVAQLIEYFYAGDLLAAVDQALHRIRGTYALGILCADCPDQLVAVRKDNPLILGWGEGCNFIASDVTAILRHTREVSYMNDGDIAVLSWEGIQCYNHLMQPIAKERVHVDWEVDAAEKGGLSPLHVQGDSGAAPGPAPVHLSPGPGRGGVLRGFLPVPGGDPGGSEDLHCGLRLQLSRGDGGQVPAGEADPGAGGSGPGL